MREVTYWSSCTSTIDFGHQQQARFQLPHKINVDRCEVKFERTHERISDVLPQLHVSVAEQHENVALWHVGARRLNLIEHW